MPKASAPKSAAGDKSKAKPKKSKEQPKESVFQRLLTEKRERQAAYQAQNEQNKISRKANGIPTASRFGGPRRRAG